MARSEKDVSRKRDFSDDEIRAIWVACDALSTQAASAVRLLIASGQRLSVVTGMKHSEIDRDNSVWTISGDEIGRSKNKNDHIVPITDLMLELIDTPTKIDGVENVFCTHHRGDKPLTLGSKLKKILDEECGVDDWTLQALRGLVVSRMRRKPLRIDRDIVDLIEGRLPTDIQRKHYDSHDYLDEKREALQRWNDHLQRILDDTVREEYSNIEYLTERPAP